MNIILWVILMIVFVSLFILWCCGYVDLCVSDIAGDDPLDREELELGRVSKVQQRLKKNIKGSLRRVQDVNLLLRRTKLKYDYEFISSDEGEDEFGRSMAVDDARQAQMKDVDAELGLTRSRKRRKKRKKKKGNSNRKGRKNSKDNQGRNPKLTYRDYRKRIKSRNNAPSRDGDWSSSSEEALESASRHREEEEGDDWSSDDEEEHDETEDEEDDGEKAMKAYQKAMAKAKVISQGVRKGGNARLRFKEAENRVKENIKRRMKNNEDKRIEKEKGTQHGTENMETDGIINLEQEKEQTEEEELVVPAPPSAPDELDDGIDGKLSIPEAEAVIKEGTLETKQNEESVIGAAHFEEFVDQADLDKHQVTNEEVNDQQQDGEQLIGNTDAENNKNSMVKDITHLSGIEHGTASNKDGDKRETDEEGVEKCGGNDKNEHQEQESYGSDSLID